MSSEKKDGITPDEVGIRLYTSFAGVLLGICVALVVLLLSYGEGETIFYSYSISCLVISAFSWLQTYEWYVYFIGTKKESDFKIGSIFYYIGYLSLILAFVFLFINFKFLYPYLISIAFSFYALFHVVKDIYLRQKSEKGFMKYISKDYQYLLTFSIILYTIFLLYGLYASFKLFVLDP